MPDMANEKRYRAMEQCYDIMSGLRRSCSHNGTGLTPARGMEQAWEHYNGICLEIQAVMREARYGTEGD